MSGCNGAKYRGPPETELRVLLGPLCAAAKIGRHAELKANVERADLIQVEVAFATAVDAP